jgi:CDP-glucose 4,6-dehydratase
MQNLNLFKGFYKGKKVVITGDTGFKGSWLSIWLKELGAEVYGYALPPKTEKDNFVRCDLREKIHHMDGDIRNKDLLLKYFSEIQPDYAFHLAAQPLVLESYRNPHYTFETNLMGTVNFFEAVRLTESVKAAVNITSDKCYQNNEWVWGYRENEPMGGDDPYSASKGCSELITNSFAKSFFKDARCNVASARAGNVIGGGDWAENRIVPDFFRALEEGKELCLRNPNSTRPWQHVLEPLSGYLSLCANLFVDGNKYNGGWNFGPLDNSHHSVLELVSLMSEKAGAGTLKVEENIHKLHEANLLKLDISKAIKYLEWLPTLNFEETVCFTVDGYNSEIRNEPVYESRISQIEKYVSAAQNRNVKWSLS